MTTRLIWILWIFPMLTEIYAKEVLPQDLVKNLGSAEFASRENAQAELLVWALKNQQAATPDLLKLIRDNDDPEVRKRTLEILKELAHIDYLSDGQGYLGIQMQPEPFEAAEDGKARMGIRIVEVIKFSPAEQAGLKRGDLIVSLDGEGWEKIEALTFSESVAAKKPGVEVILMVKRVQAGDFIRFAVKLGKRPILDFQAGGDLGQLEQQAKERHFKEWLKNQQKE